MKAIHRCVWISTLLVNMLFAVFSTCVSASEFEATNSSKDKTIIEPDTESDIDLKKFMGRWHIIAHIPYFAERGHVATFNDYILEEDGDILVEYSYQDGFDQPIKQISSTAKVSDNSGHRIWKNWLFYTMPMKYRILEVAPDYSWALMDSPNRDRAWILSRETYLNEKDYRALVTKLKTYGVNQHKLRKVPQIPNQVGQLGFADPKKP